MAIAPAFPPSPLPPCVPADGPPVPEEPVPPLPLPVMGFGSSLMFPLEPQPSSAQIARAFRVETIRFMLHW